MSTTFTETIFTTFEVIACGGCGIKFGVPQNWINEKQRNAGSFHCPNGCNRTYSESEATRLRRDLAAKEVELRASNCETLSERMAREVAEKKLRRARNGVCPDCNRSFPNLKRHMETKHKKPTSKLCPTH